MRPNSQSNRGFTTIELMITLVVLAIVAAVAIPAWQQLTLKSRLLTHSHGIFNAFTQARQTAIMQRAPVTLCAGNATTGCQTGRNAQWQDGYMVFLDRNQNGVLDAGERLVFENNSPASGLIIAGNTPMNKPVIFLPQGFAEQPGGAFSAGRVRICATRNFDGHAQDVILLKSGMARIESNSFGGTCPAP